VQRPKLSSATLAGFVAIAGGLALNTQAALAAPPEAPTTRPASAIARTTATLNGELNPKASAKAGYHFTFNTNGACTGGVTTEPGAEAAGKAIKVAAAVSGLVPSTSYTFCVVATNAAAESTSGVPQVFMTLASKPLVESEASSGVTPFAATLEAQINPENQATTNCKFEYGKTTAYGSSAACGPAVVEGSATQLESAGVSGLKAATTYHFRVVVKNATGTTGGLDREFATPALAAPSVLSESASGVSSTDAMLGASVNPNFQETTYGFEYAPNEALSGATTLPGAMPLPAVSEALSVAPTDIGGGLVPGSTYFYRVVATNASGTTHGLVQQFVTQAAPILTTGEASDVTRTSASLAGSVDPGGAETRYHFVYGQTPGYGSATAETVATGSAHVSEPVAGPLAELRPGTAYHYALVATNAVGTTVGPDRSFATSPPTPPITMTGPAEGVSQLGATITGTVDTRELQTVVAFEFGTVLYGGSLVPATLTPGPGSVATISVTFTNALQPGTSYYYRVVAHNGDGPSFGAAQSFTTATFIPGFNTPAAPQLIPFTSVAELSAKEPHGATAGFTAVTTPPTRLAIALKACRREPKRRRSGCERKARKRYGTTQKHRRQR
jgi:phosphodiesterase/alkaline phosphatase D-like protein